MNKTMLSLAYGHVAFMAAEMGDQQSRQKLLDYAERNFHPVWEEGTYYYPRSDDYATDANGNSHGMSAWTGNALLALTRLDTGGSFQRLYQQPWGRAELDAPQITNVDELLVNVSQAYYDAAKHALIVTLKPGPVKAGSNVSFVVRNLDQGATYSLVKDGKVQGQISKEHANVGRDFTWNADGTVSVSTTLQAPHSFVMVAN
jgi:hypothetical protein